jgi:CHASE3 domain sensor protein
LQVFETSELLVAARWVKHTQEVKVSLGNLVVHVTDAQTGVRGFVITGKETFLEPYHNAVGSIDRAVADLQRLTADNAEHVRRLDDVKSIVADQLNYLSRTITTRRIDGFDAAQSLVVTEYGKRKMAAMRGIISEMSDAEGQLLQQRQANMDAHTRDTGVILGVGAFLSFLITLSASVSINRELRKRRRVESELRRAYDDLDERVKQRTQELEDVNADLRQEALERQRAQNLLQQSDERFRHALTAARLGTWEWEIATDHVTTYGHQLPLFGLADGQFSDKRSAFMGRMHDEDRPRVEHNFCNSPSAVR